jgi:hypothetical protein
MHSIRLFLIRLLFHVGQYCFLEELPECSASSVDGMSAIRAALRTMDPSTLNIPSTLPSRFEPPLNPYCYTPTNLSRSSVDDPFVSAALGESHTLLLTKTGEVSSVATTKRIRLTRNTRTQRFDASCIKPGRFGPLAAETSVSLAWATRTAACIWSAYRHCVTCAPSRRAQCTLSLWMPTVPSGSGGWVSNHVLDNGT